MGQADDIRYGMTAERSRCIKKIEAMKMPESGPDYSMASEDERRAIRASNRLLDHVIHKLSQ